MQEFLLFMYDDAANPAAAADGRRWSEYLDVLRKSGRFDGGSSIGSGILARREQADRPATGNVTGFLRVRAADLEAARGFLTGNPVYEAGGTVEIRELLVD